MLIAIEGIDGAGKRTQTDLLKTKAETLGYSVGMLSFPRYGLTLMARAIADYLNGLYGKLNDIPAQFPALLYAGDRFESRDLLRTLLREKDVVIVDRYVGSNLAYQAAKMPREERRAFIGWLTQVEYDMYGLPPADITVYLDVPVRVSSALVARKAPRNYTKVAADLHERDTSYLAACRDVYASLHADQHMSRWIAVNCVDDAGSLHSIAAIHGAVWEGLEAFVAPATGGGATGPGTLPV